MLTHGMGSTPPPPCHVDDDVPLRHSKSHGAVDPNVAVQPTDHGDTEARCDLEARRPTAISPVAAPFPFLHRHQASEVGVPPVSLFVDDVAVWTQDTDLERATS